MQEERSSKPGEVAGQVEQAIFVMLVADERCHWSVREIEMEIGDDVKVIDGLDALHRAGLIHRCDDFVFATRAAVRSQQLAL